MLADRDERLPRHVPCSIEGDPSHSHSGRGWRLARHFHIADVPWESWQRLPLLSRSPNRAKRFVGIALIARWRCEPETLEVLVRFAGLHHRLDRLSVETASIIHAPLSSRDFVGQIDCQEIRFFLVAAVCDRSFGAFQDDAAVILDQLARLLGFDAVRDPRTRQSALTVLLDQDAPRLNAVPRSERRRRRGLERDNRIGRLDEWPEDRINDDDNALQGDARLTFYWLALSPTGPTVGERRLML
jgi:hypothetical protein